MFSVTSDVMIICCQKIDTGIKEVLKFEHGERNREVEDMVEFLYSRSIGSKRLWRFSIPEWQVPLVQ